MPKDKTFKYKEQGYELSPMRVVYADAECMTDFSDKIKHICLQLLACIICGTKNVQRLIVDGIGFGMEKRA